MGKKNLLIGLVLFLAVTNVATILTVWLHIRNQDRETVSNQTTVVAGDTTEIPGEQRVNYMAEQLKLTPVQRDSFQRATREYAWKARTISQEMSLLRDQLLDEMDKESPDSVKLSQFSEQIGQEHTNLKKLSVDHYLDLKSYCTPDQKRELFEMFKKILKPDGDVNVPRGPGPPGGNRGRQGKGGRGPWWQNQQDSVFNK